MTCAMWDVSIDIKKDSQIQGRASVSLSRLFKMLETAPDLIHSLVSGFKVNFVTGLQANNFII